MKYGIYKVSKPLFFVFFLIFNIKIFPDSFNYNSYNNHGVVGLINTPTARFYNEAVAGISIYDGTPDRKITMTASPYDWLEASFFYTSIQGRGYLDDPNGDYIDKGFNFKLRLKEEGQLPALAIGVYDIAGTGFYSSEYIVASYGIGKIDLHFGLGWGNLDGSSKSFKNPLGYVDNSFKNRPVRFESYGGQFQPSRYFSGKTVSPFGGISYSFSNRLLFKAEHDTTSMDGLIDFELPSREISFSFEYNLSKNLTIGLARERDNFYSLKFIYKTDAKSKENAYKYSNVKYDKSMDKYGNFIKKLQSNGIGVNRIIEKADSIGIEISQFTHPNLDLVEEILMTAKMDSGIKKDIKTDIRIADLQASNDIEDQYYRNSKLIYERDSKVRYETSTKLKIRPFIAAREGFFKLALLLENDSEFIIKDNLFFASNIKYSIKDNFEDLVMPPKDIYPAQVRSDVKQYLRNFENRAIIGRAQFDYHITPIKNNHIMVTAGILEEMFLGYGFEYLFFNNNKNYALGFELFNVRKRDYDLRFGTLDYKNTTGHANFYYRNYDLIPFDAKISYGEYLAGDKGTTIEFSRTYRNGAQFGVFASFTDVTAEKFGEGSFDKGIFFNIPIYKNFIDYSWRPLTKDPGAKLNRKHTLHDLLVKFRPYNQ